MSAAAVGSAPHSPVPVLAPDTTPRAIRDSLIDEERADFERAYRQAIEEAAGTLDLTAVLDVLRNYHRIGQLTQQHGVAAHRRMLDHAERALRTREAAPGSASAHDVRTMMRERLAE